jgi:glycosyltransferase (TIGR04182 family)
MKVTVVVPALNEEPTIGKVVRDFRKCRKVSEVVVYDGRSSDRTRELARKAGARVIVQKGRGKGRAVREIFRNVDTDIYVLVDGDDTYPAEALDSLLGPVVKGEADMVVGTRMGKESEKGSLNMLHRFGNRVISGTISAFFGRKLRDVLSGYRALSRDLAKGLELDSQGFEIETELTIKSLIGGYRILEVPVSYRSRPSGSVSKLGSFGDGYLIFYTMVSMFRDYRPFLFFFVLSLIFGFAGLVLGLVVVDEWLATGAITRMPTAILSALLIFLSVQFFSLGIILDFIKKMFAGQGPARG